MTEQPVACLHSRTFTAARQGFAGMQSQLWRGRALGTSTGGRARLQPMLTFIVQGGGGGGARLETETRAGSRGSRAPQRAMTLASTAKP
eukprot:2475800-Rhodomonas_salina.1